MKTIALVLFVLALAVLVIKGFSWIWLVVAILSGLALAWNGVSSFLDKTTESG